MELRKLKALLGALQAAGVTSFREGDLTLTFGAAPMEVPRGDVEVPEADTSWAAGGLGLQRAIDRINKAYTPKGKAQ